MDTFTLAIIGVVIIFAVGIPISLFQKKIEQEEIKKYKSREMSQEEQEKFEAKLKLQQENNEQLRKASTISKVMIVGANSDSRKSISSSIIRGAVGSTLLGPVGLVGGALSGKNKVTSKTTFLVEYKDGHRETKIIDNDSSEFKELCKYLEIM